MKPVNTLAPSSPPLSGDRIRSVVFGLFFASGFCSLLYQVVWLRMAFAHFGIVTPVLSVVIAVFMLGLGVGSLLAGRWGASLGAHLGWSPAAVYGMTELLIGVGALAVPALLGEGETLLLAIGAASSAGYLALSALAITLSILPWCVLMGATLPLMMIFVRARWPQDTQSFSFLYLANLLGAVTGTLASACVLIEIFGFRNTSLIAAIVNWLIAAVSFWLSRADKPLPGPASLATLAPARPARPLGVSPNLVLFTTGFTSLAMEVIWTRDFTVILRTTIYAFAAILATYLLGTALGAAMYRRRLRQGTMPHESWLLLSAAFAACLPVLLDDPRLPASPVGVLFSITPFCAILGFLTPKLIDLASGGDPARAARGYAVNILGSILGPLFAGYVLVTRFDVRVCLLILAVPLLGLGAQAVLRSQGKVALRHIALAGCAGALLFGFFVSRSYEGGMFDRWPHQVRRDYAATAIAFGGGGRAKGLMVNGVGMTALTPITKIMAHLPLALHGHAKDGLVICFGMGTTLRAMASWGIETTAVDLSRSVIDSFGFFHADAASVIASPKVHLIADDGRRFLARSGQSYDVIVIDPPPPVEAAGSSLLYSREMYDVLKQRLRAGGLLLQWFPGKNNVTEAAVVRTLMQAFPYVVAYRSIENYGVNYLASMQPVPEITVAPFVARLPEKARQDLLEWGPQPTAEGMAALILGRRLSVADIVPDPRQGPIISDDRPFNEYFLVRNMVAHWAGASPRKPAGSP